MLNENYTDYALYIAVSWVTATTISKKELRHEVEIILLLADVSAGRGAVESNVNLFFFLKLQSNLIALEKI